MAYSQQGFLQCTPIPLAQALPSADWGGGEKAKVRPVGCQVLADIQAFSFCPTKTGPCTNKPLQRSAQPAACFFFDPMRVTVCLERPEGRTTQDGQIKSAARRRSPVWETERSTTLFCTYCRQERICQPSWMYTIYEYGMHLCSVYTV